MKVRVIQPPYPWKPAGIGDTVSFMLDELNKCDDNLDLILLPECCNAACGCGDSEKLIEYVMQYTDPLISAVRDTAVRCNCVIGINLYYREKPQAVQNTTLLFNRKGELAGKYIKQHLPISEYSNTSIDHDYITQADPPQCVQIDGIRYAFLTCYDVYYSEFIHRIAMEKPDVVLISSLQRAEREDILEMQVKNCAFVCNAFVVRSSYGMGVDTDTGGCSMVVSPEGKVLCNFHQELGSMDYSIEDVHYKYMRSNGFGQATVPNDAYQTYFRSPWCYRAGGSGVIPTNQQMPFPRLCAHRGFIPAAPENTIPCIAVALSMGAAEIEIDVRPTKDGILVISHDPHVRRLTDSDGIIQQMTYEELRKLDLGRKYAPYYEGVSYATLEEVFQHFPRRAIFNLHVKPLEGVSDYRPIIRQIMELAQKYDCMEHFYFASEGVEILEAARDIAPQIERCALTPETGYVTGEMVVETAIKYGCSRFQSLRQYMTESVIEKAHKAGIKCNLFYSDEPEDAKEWLKKGIDVILTDNYLAVSRGTELH